MCYLDEYLHFELEADGDWPPFKMESLPVRKLGENFEILVPPFFIQDLSCGDVIEICRYKSDRVISWDYYKKSERSTVWILNNDDINIEIYIQKLKNLGCNIERLNDIKLYSLDIPKGLNVETILDEIDRKGLFVAYPSYRLK